MKQEENKEYVPVKDMKDVLRELVKISNEYVQYTIDHVI